MKKPLSELVLHPYLLTAYFCIFLVAHNLGEIVVTDAMVAAVASLAVCSIALLVLMKVTKNAQKAGLAVSCLVLSFFSYGRAHSALRSVGFLFQNQKLFFPLWVLLTGLLVFLVLRLRSPLAAKNGGAIGNVVAAVLFVMPVIVIVAQIARGQVGASSDRLKTSADAVPVLEQIDAFRGLSLKSDPLGPDLYYIILDGYARADTLALHFQHDNGPFLSFLRGRGFFVAETSTSNYAFTALSLASSLNGSYLDPVAAALGGSSTNLHPLNSLIVSNGVTRVLQESGFRVVQIGSWWKVRSVDSADRTRARYRFLNEFNILLLSTSILSVIDGELLAPLMRKSVLDSFAALERAAAIPERKFVFAHIVSPHQPYLFGRNGEPLGTVKSIYRRLDTRNGFLDQSIFITTRITKTIEEILRVSERPPIIVLQSDHGCGTVWSTAISGIGVPTPEFLRAQFGILNAYLAPPQLQSALYESISPVNTFRVIINSLAQEPLPLLADRSYFSTFTAPYKLQDVTDIVRAPGPR